MHSTCLHCTRPLGTNEVLETLPIGRRIAFDAANGRLWVVCKHCGKWNLVPFDTRLESIDAAERLYSATVTRYSTDNIGLARVREGLELVRIGGAPRPEFAAWRYGERYRRRRRNTMLAGGAGVAIAGGIAVAGSTMLFGLVGLGTFWSYGVLDSVWRFSTRRRARCRVVSPGDGRPITLWHHQLQGATIGWDGVEPSLDLSAPGLGARSGGALRWTGPALRGIGRRVTGGLNFLAGNRRDLEGATRLLAETKGEMVPWLRQRTGVQCARGGENHSWRYPGIGSPHWRSYQSPYLRLGLLPARERLAIEMWMNEDIERIWLEGELKLLEREWREAERLAKIADDLVLEPEVTGEW